MQRSRAQLRGSVEVEAGGAGADESTPSFGRQCAGGGRYQASSSSVVVQAESSAPHFVAALLPFLKLSGNPAAVFPTDPANPGFL